MRLTRSQLPGIVARGEFLWLSGIEDTFITAPSKKTGRTLDEYELTEHYARWAKDVELLAGLGVQAARYGLPWHRINPAPGTWDFGWADRPLERLLALGVEPVVDLVHYGLPGWIEGAWLHPDLPRFMAEYAARIAERFRGRVFAYTPLNEPRITAWYCGKLGWWPPNARGWRGFVSVMLAVCRGIVASARALQAVDPELVFAHVDATDLFEATHPSLAAEAARRQALVFLALDLFSGRVSPGHALWEWLLAQGAPPAVLEELQASAVPLDLVGLNLYPLFSDKRLVQSPRGLRVRMPYATAAIIDRLATLYWERYQCPLFISETASEGSLQRRGAWLEDSLRAVARVRARSIPLIGYTWWPLFALVTWGYREGHKGPGDYLKQMGLFDLAKTEHGLERVETPLAHRYRALAAQGAAAITALPEERTDVP